MTITEMPPRRLRASLRPAAEWYRIRNADTGTAVIDLFDEIGWFGTTAQQFVSDLRKVNASMIQVHVNSPGGDVWDALTIHNALKQHPAQVHVQVDGLAASAASFIAMAGDSISIARGAQFMIHDAIGFAVDNPAGLRTLADLLDKVSDDIAGFYARRAGGSATDWRAAMRAETWYTADEAVAAGLADSIQGEADTAAVSNTWDLSVFTYAGREAAPPPVDVRGQAPAPTPVEPPPASADPIDKPPADPFAELADHLCTPDDDLFASLRGALTA